MNKKFLFALVALLVASSVFAGTLNVVSSFLSQKYWRKGLEYAGGYLYTTSNYSDNTIHVYTTAGSLVRSIRTVSNSMGVEVSNAPKGYIWVNTYSPYSVVLLTTAGSVSRSFSGPAAGYGLTSNGPYLWYSSATARRIYQMTTTGSLVRSFSPPGSFAGGIDYANGYLWFADWPSSGGRLYYMTTTGSVIDSFPTPGAQRPAGCTWDGTYVWYHHYTMAQTGWCFRAKVIFSGVAPASLGKVKALFK